MSHYIFGVDPLEEGHKKTCPACKQLLPNDSQVHLLFGAEGYNDSMLCLERLFHHRPYKNGRYFSRVRKLQFFGVFEFYDFTIEEPAEKEFLADLRCFFLNDIEPQHDSLLNFWPFNIFQKESFKGENQTTHFKKYAAWRFFSIAFGFLRFFGLQRPKFSQKSFLRDQLSHDGQSFLVQGFFVGKIEDRKERGTEML